MSKLDKLIQKMSNKNATWTWNELVSLLTKLGYEKVEGAGSRVKFDNGNIDHLINMHKPHPSNEVKDYAIRQVREILNKGGLI